MSSSCAALLSSTRVAWLAALVLLLSAAPAAPQSDHPPGGALAVLPVVLNARAAVEISEADRRLVAGAEERLHRGLAEGRWYRVVERERVAEALRRAELEPHDCTGVTCTAAVGETTGADRVLVVVLTKFSGLIWFADARLMDARTGESLHGEFLELKGAPADMVPGGMASLARRMRVP